MSKQMSRLVKFGIVGMFNTVADFVVFALLSAAGMTVLPAQWISYGCGMVNSYMWNRNWTFRDSRSQDSREALRFILVNLAAFTAAAAILDWLYGHMNVSLPVCKLIATSASVLINYLGSRFLVFHTSDKGVKSYEN
ncbi:GtrA family protein [Paenibacillus piri]|uniref:GtrA family protein n=1 Tax=Paenibacillus piri TaxID=2547395 RepID=A0A4R5KNM7_9BACL|nr:GtrA family protein [Paenibacillus piri]TDF96200.1 GtrA family protein [Paenibacillus piri]